MQYEEFNKEIAPFCLMIFDEDPKDTWASLVLHEVGSYQQAIFEAISDDGFEGDGYDWQELARAFLKEKMPNLSKELTFDSESSLFCVRSNNIPLLQEFALAFTVACQDVEGMANLLSPAFVQPIQKIDEQDLALVYPQFQPFNRRVSLAEGDIFLLTPPLQSDPVYACRLVYLSFETKGLCAYILSTQPVDTELFDLKSIDYDSSRVIYSSIHFMKWGLWKKLGHQPLTESEENLTLRNVGNYRLMNKDKSTDMITKEHKEDYPLQPVYGLIEVFAVIYGKQYKKKDPRFLAWAYGEIDGRLA